MTDIWKNEQPGLIVKELSAEARASLIANARDDIDDFRDSLPENSDRKLISTQQADSKSKTLHQFQRDTLANWEQNNFHGVIKHATGSGKTVTAITALKPLKNRESALVVIALSVASKTVAN